MKVIAATTMNSRDIADLVESRHDDVKRSIERLAQRGVITLPPLAEVSNLGAGPRTIGVYVIGKRDSYVIVAQLSPEFTARLVDRWQELETEAATAPVKRVGKVQSPVVAAASMMPTLVRALRACGIDKNAAAIGANQIATAQTGVNLLAMAGHSHLPTLTQEVCFTPTELGKRFCQSAIVFNRRLADAGLQESIGGHWVPTEKAANTRSCSTPAKRTATARRSSR